MNIKRKFVQKCIADVFVCVILESLVKVLKCWTYDSELLSVEWLHRVCKFTLSEVVITFRHSVNGLSHVKCSCSFESFYFTAVIFFITDLLQVIMELFNILLLLMVKRRMLGSLVSNLDSHTHVHSEVEIVGNDELIVKILVVTLNKNVIEFAL